MTIKTARDRPGAVGGGGLRLPHTLFSFSLHSTRYDFTLLDLTLNSTLLELTQNSMCDWACLLHKEEDKSLSSSIYLSISLSLSSHSIYSLPIKQASCLSLGLRLALHVPIELIVKSFLIVTILNSLSHSHWTCPPDPCLSILCPQSVFCEILIWLRGWVLSLVSCF
jgi:hypothetical protein